MRKSEPRWVSFQIIDEIFPSENRIRDIMQAQDINRGVFNVEPSKEEFNKFLRNAFFAMRIRDDVTNVPEYLDLPLSETNKLFIVALLSRFS